MWGHVSSGNWNSWRAVKGERSMLLNLSCTCCAWPKILWSLSKVNSKYWRKAGSSYVIIFDFIEIFSRHLCVVLQVKRLSLRSCVRVSLWHQTTALNFHTWGSWYKSIWTRLGQRSKMWGDVSSIPDIVNLRSFGPCFLRKGIIPGWKGKA